MSTPLSAPEAVCRLLAASWDPQELPEPEMVPWFEVLRLVGPSNVAAVVHAVTAPVRLAIPPEVQQALELAFFRATAAHTRAVRQLGMVGQALSALGVPLLLLKGAALSQTLYPEPALRLVGDLDLVVPGEHASACRQALLACGYVPARQEHRPGFLLTQTNQELFEPPEPLQVPVELHWHILDVPYYLRRIPIGWFWTHTHDLVIAGQTFKALDPMANLVYLPAHLALHHALQRWHALLDLALLVRQNQHEIDWQAVVAAASSFDLLSALDATLARLQECWPSLPLAGPRRLAAAAQPSEADARLFRLLTSGSRSDMLDFYTTFISLGFSDRARYAWAQLFPQPDYMLERYPVRARWLLPYWYFHRLAGGLFQFARSLPQARRIDRGW